ncbi:MAG: nuclear transport factor 2 family protein [Sphingomonas sp.]|nr:nuclear transport factor 2 family protein [Sphingomonas sp.]
MSARKIITGALLLAAAALPVAAQAQGGDMRSQIAAYKHRVMLLEDQDAVENLQATFGYYFDKGLWNQAADLFAANGSFEYGQRGVYIGPARIRQSMLLFGPQGLAKGHLNNHMMLQPIIVVAPDGRTATGRWQGMVMLSEPGQNGKWGVGLYENEYVKDGGVWKIAKLHFYMTALTDYDLGFAKSAIQMEGPSALFPPDKPPTEVYRSFPSAYLPPFSYKHPVTGQSLKDLPLQGDDIVGRPDRGMDSEKGKAKP